MSRSSRAPAPLLAPLAIAVCTTIACGASDPDTAPQGPVVSDADADAHGDVVTDGAVEDAEVADSAGDASDAPQEGGGPEPNAGWIGAACASEGECAYAGATCLIEGYPGGMCSMPCEGACPDPVDPGHAATFCVEDPDAAGEGVCLARCAWGWFPDVGCREGMECKWRERLDEAWMVEDVCVADDGTDACAGDEVRQPNVGLEEPPGIGGCPAGMAPLYESGACIDRWECHLVEVLEGGSTAPWSPYFNPGDRVVMAVSAPGAVPQGYIAGEQAAAACAQAGKRLCTRGEWELACMGPEGRTYPYGDEREPGLCNDARSEHPAVEYFGTAEAWIWSELGHACLNQLESSLERAGARGGCVTDGAVFDLMGNLHEWVDDPAGTFKGGFYVDTELNGEGCWYTTTAHSTGYWDYSTGFRCCADP